MEKSIIWLYHNDANFEIYDSLPSRTQKRVRCRFGSAPFCALRHTTSRLIIWPMVSAACMRMLGVEWT